MAASQYRKALLYLRNASSMYDELKAAFPSLRIHEAASMQHKAGHIHSHYNCLLACL